MPKKAPAKKSTKIKKDNDTGNKLGVFNKKRLIVLVALLAFGAFGLYMLRQSKAYSTYYASYLNNAQAKQCIQPASSPGLPPTQSLGSRGPCVYAIQEGLNNWTTSQQKAGNSKNSPNVGGYIAVDGIFGQATKDKVINFQRAKGAQGKNTTPDGIMGPATWTTFFNDCNVFNMCAVTTSSSPSASYGK